jgi:hypothetical protein
MLHIPDMLKKQTHTYTHDSGIHAIGKSLRCTETGPRVRLGSRSSLRRENISVWGAVVASHFACIGGHTGTVACIHASGVYNVNMYLQTLEGTPGQ